MKIVIKKNDDSVICHVQVKDFLKLARINGDKKYVQYYIHFVNNGKGDNDFIDISNTSYADDIVKCSDIVNFMDYKDMSIQGISQQIVQFYSFVTNLNGRGEVESRIDDMRDIIAYKKGELNYLIPVVLDYRISLEDTDNNLVFSSSIVNGCYLIKNKNGEDISNTNYDVFLNQAIDRIYEDDYPEYDGERDYQVHQSGGCLLIVVNNIKKKKSIVDRILGKIKPN